MWQEICLCVASKTSNLLCSRVPQFHEYIYPIHIKCKVQKFKQIDCLTTIGTFVNLSLEAIQSMRAWDVHTGIDRLDSSEHRQPRSERGSKSIDTPEAPSDTRQALVMYHQDLKVVKQILHSPGDDSFDRPGPFQAHEPKP